MTFAPAPPARDAHRGDLKPLETGTVTTAPASSLTSPVATTSALPAGAAASIGLEALIGMLCRQYSHATGWRLEFFLEAAEVPAIAASWQASVSDGVAPIGTLRLLGSRGETSCSFVQATEMAAGLVQALQALAESHRRLASRTEEVSTLVNLGMAVPVRENLAWSLAQLLRAAVRLTAARSASFFLLDPSLTQLRLRAVWQIDAREVPQTVRKVLDSRCDREALLHGASVAGHGEGPSAPLPDACRSALVVPVESETMPLGTLWIHDRRSRSFGEHERHVLQSIAAQIAGVLERVALLRGSENHERIARELEVATRAQPSLLPNDLPADPRYELAAHVASCHELGGDLCEIIALPHSRVGLAVGDASGHSIAAAMIMAAVRGALRVLVNEDLPPQKLMHRLNEALYSITRSHQFMSLCYALFEPGPRRLTYVNAGHPLPLLLRKGAITSLASHGLLLGVIRETDYAFSTLELQAGDLLVFYTDGISEARSSAQEQMFRADGVAAALLESQHGTAQEVLSAIWNRVEHHLAGTSADDDRTLVVLRIK